jgi:hypothetical protein
MKPTTGGRNRWLVAVGGLALGLATSGCSSLIAQSSGVSSMSEALKLETRAEVRAFLGEAEETGTCPDGRTVERRAIRQQTKWVLSGLKDEAGQDPRAYVLFPPAEVVALPIQAYRSEQAKFQYAWVYGADDRVLYRYNVAAAPADRFREAVRPVAAAVYLQLRKGECPSWERRLSAYAAEARQRAACVAYPLTPVDEATFHRVQTLAADADAGRIPPDEALAGIEACLW